MNEVSLDKIVQLVVQEVVAELTRRGVKIVQGGKSAGIVTSSGDIRTKVERIDMSGYRTPILTEHHIRKLHELTGEIVVPAGTIVTPKAQEMIRARGLTLTTG
ncbi:hypothetical protein JW960_00740 [candidate division KSB1 bacterium]|nr:hypothetical protein [candidate division KSB1 bacterium]